MLTVISTSSLFPWQILIIFCYSFSFFNICHAACKDKYNSFLTFLAIFAAKIPVSLFFNSVLASVYSFLDNVVYVILCCVILHLLTDANFVTRLSVAVVYSISSFLVALTMSWISTKIYGGASPQEVFGENGDNKYHLVVFLIYCIFIISASFLFAALIKFVSVRKNKNSEYKLKYAYFTLLPVTHIMIVMLLGAFPAYNDVIESIFGSTVVFITCAACLFFDVSFVFVIDHIEKLESKNILAQKLLVKSEMDYQQMLLLKEEKQEFRKIRHDFANLLVTAQGFIEIGKPEKALEIIKKTTNNISKITGVSLCSNETINTVLYIKQQHASAVGVALKTEVDESFAVNIDDYDLCRVLHNIIDNSLNAAEKTNVKASSIRISITKEALVIESENPFIPEAANRSGLLHGNGIGIIKEIAKKYNGHYQAHSENGLYHTRTTLENTACKAD